MKLIPLTQGKSAIVDDDQYDFLMQWKWHAAKCSNTFYARRKTWKDGKEVIVYMHRVIANNPDTDLIVDHADGNGLNNTYTNIRICTISQNQMNRFSRRTNQFKGVSERGTSGIFRARIRKDGKLIHLGNFKTQIDAANCYDLAAKNLFGDFARTNNSLNSLTL